MQKDCLENTHSDGTIQKLIDYELVSEGAAYFSNGEYDCSPEQAYDHVASSICNFVPLMGDKHPVIFYSLEDLAL